MHNLHHELSRLDSGKHIHAERFLLYTIGKGLCNLVVDIGIKQGTAHIFQCLGNINLGNLALSLQYLERAFKAFT